MAGLDAGSAKGQLELDVDGWKQGFDDAANAAKRAESAINGTMVSAGKEVDKLGTEFKETAKDSDALGKASISLEDKLGSLLATAGTMATLKAGVSAIMGSMNSWAEAEASADRLRVALEFRGLEGSLSTFNELASKLQTITGVSDDTVKQLAAESIAQGKSVQQTMDTLNAAAAYASATGIEMSAAFEMFNKTLSGTAGRLGQTIPALKQFTEVELQNGAAIEYINAEYGAFTGQVGSTKIALSRMNETVGDASETFGSAMAPMVLLVTDAITGLASVVANAGTIMKTVMAVGATALMAVFTGLAVRTAIVAAAKWGLFGAQMAVNAATAVGNPLMWVGIAAAVGMVAATGALVASKVREANATKAASVATAENTNRVRSASEVVGKYAGQLDSFSVAQLKAARAELVAAQSRATYSAEIVAIGKKIAEIDTLIGEKNKAAFEASAADRYKTAMESVKKAIDDTITAEQKLEREIEAVEKIRGGNAEEEKQRIAALVIMNNRLSELKAERAKKEKEENDAARDSYRAMMNDIFKLIDERKVKESELLGKIEKLEAQKTATQEDEAARLDALAVLYQQLGRVQEEIDGVSLWQETSYALHDYIEKVKQGQVTLKGLAKFMTSATSSLYSQAQEIVSQYFTNELAEVENAYAREQEALDKKHEDGLLSDEEYKAQTQALEEEAAKKKNEIAEKQFTAEKESKIANIWMSAAEAIAGWWSASTDLGYPAGPIVAGLMTAATFGMAVEQTSLVSKQEYVPSYATGGTHDGGLAQINEQGGELVDLPDGTVIVPAELSARIAEDAGRDVRQEYTISFPNAVIEKGVDLDALAEKLSRKIAKKVRR